MNNHSLYQYDYKSRLPKRYKKRNKKILAIFFSFFVITAFIYTMVAYIVKPSAESASDPSSPTTNVLKQTDNTLSLPQPVSDSSTFSKTPHHITTSDTITSTSQFNNNIQYNHTITIKSGDTLSAIFKRLSISSTELYNLLHAGKTAKRLHKIKPGDILQLHVDKHKNVTALRYSIDKITTLFIIKNKDNHFHSFIETKETQIKKRFVSGQITQSLYYTAQQEQISNRIIMQLAQIFGWDIDFALDLRKNDAFSIIYEEIYTLDKEKVTDGNILAAEFINQQQVYRAVRYQAPNGDIDYYNPQGYRLQKAFLRTPVAFSRISSGFSLGRKHPVLNRIRAHKGVDYAASKGTPIKATGDGTIIYHGRKGGYGKTLIIQHGNQYTTLYAHMSRYAKNTTKGSRVKQGQIIGYVGSTGLATGPHLHYEFRIHGVHKNPLTIKLPKAIALKKSYLKHFKKYSSTLLAELSKYQQQILAHND